MDDVMDPLEYAYEWLEFAKRDVSSAEYLMNMWPRPDEIICYLSQQSAEKSLKGFLVTNDITPPKIHNLLNLCGLCAAYNAEINNLVLQLEYLNQFSVISRYPRELTLTEPDAQTAVDYAKIVLEFIKSRFPHV
jgi:HEPN domain-containing protein